MAMVADSLELEAQWRQARRTDAQLIVAWLSEQGHHPRLLAQQAHGWTDFDWRVIEDETGIRCSVTVRNHVLDMLREAS